MHRVMSSYHRSGMVKDMTEAREAAVITEALTVIDEALAKILNRELVSTEEVADLLLDVRVLLTTNASSTTQA